MTFTVHFGIGKAESPLYFYFRFIRSTDPENVQHVSLVMMTTRCRIISFLLSILYVTHLKYKQQDLYKQESLAFNARCSQFTASL